jgi:hypothetical protein
VFLGNFLLGKHDQPHQGERVLRDDLCVESRCISFPFSRVRGLAVRRKLEASEAVRVAHDAVGRVDLAKLYPFQWYIPGRVPPSDVEGPRCGDCAAAATRTSIASRATTTTRAAVFAAPNQRQEAERQDA